MRQSARHGQQVETPPNFTPWNASLCDNWGLVSVGGLCVRSEAMGEIWRYRELLYFFAWRDLKVRYKQAALGATWAIVQPLFTMLTFTVFFGKLAGISSGSTPYPLFSYSALVLWTYFSFTLG